MRRGRVSRVDLVVVIKFRECSAVLYLLEAERDVLPT